MAAMSSGSRGTILRSAFRGRPSPGPRTGDRSSRNATSRTRPWRTLLLASPGRPSDPERDLRVGSSRESRGYTGSRMTRRPTRQRPAPLGHDTWVVLPTYNEADNLRTISAAIMESLPGATLLVVDDGSPDGTGTIADELSVGDPRIQVRHRAAKQGLGRAYLDGFGVALAGGAAVVVQMDADWSHDPATLAALIGPITDDDADLVIGSRYTAGGGVVDWGIGRRLISRGGSLFAKTVLRLRPSDLTGGFKAWRGPTPPPRPLP